MGIASLRTHTDAVIDALAGTGVLVGDADDRDTDGAKIGGWQGTPGQSAFAAYAILYPLLGGTFDGSIAAPDDDAELHYQVTCVGASREQCEWVLDQVVDVLLDPGAITIPDRSVIRVIPDMAGGGVRRDDTVQPPVFISTPRFRLWTTPVSQVP